MVRTRIKLSEWQARRLRAQARQRGVSLAEIIQRHVEKGLADDSADRAARYDRVAQMVGRFRDRHGARDLASGHDRHLDATFGSPQAVDGARD